MKLTFLRMLSKMLSMELITLKNKKAARLVSKNFPCINKSILIIALCWTAYLISYIGRTDYNACLVEIVRETGISRVTAGTVSSAFAICYSAGQLISAFCMKKLSPLKVIGAELLSVACINFLFSRSDTFVLMAVLWGINGCIQSTLLSGITKIFSNTLSEPYLSRGAVALNTVGAAGGLLNYVLSWVFISFSNWRYLFSSVAFSLLLLCVIWFIAMPQLCKSESKNKTAENKAENEPVVSSAPLSKAVPVFVIAGAFFIGTLRESVSLWIPSYISEVFNLSTASSVIATVFVPCLQICGAFAGGYFGRKTNNLLFASAITFLLSGSSLAIIGISGNANLFLSVAFFAVNAVCMTTALTFLLSLFPIAYFNKKTLPFMVGIINFSVHCGDFTASLGIGWLSQQTNWSTVFTALPIMAASAAFICTAGGYILKKGRTPHVCK